MTLKAAPIIGHTCMPRWRSQNALFDLNLAMLLVCKISLVSSDTYGLQYVQHRAIQTTQSEKPSKVLKATKIHSLRHKTYLGKTFWYVHVLFVILSVFGTLAMSKNGVYQFFYKRINFHNSPPFVFFGLKWINKSTSHSLNLTKFCG